MDYERGPLVLKKHEGPDGPPVIEIEDLEKIAPRDADEDEPAAPRIRCPQCSWQPPRDARWSCTCLFVWNTFDTGGCCPRCRRDWHDTQCLECFQWSPHLEWYADDDDESSRGRRPS